MDTGALAIGRDAGGNTVTAGADASQGVDVSTQSAARASIDKIDAAIQQVSAERAQIGANQNRLVYTSSMLSIASQNTSDAESRITGVDMASETANLSRAHILMQASTAIMAQANQSAQMVLRLLSL
jgi:flagellin